MVLAPKLPKKKIQGHFTVLNDKGLHTRPSTELVKCANRYQAEISLTYKGVAVNAKSLLGILMLSASRGAKVKIDAAGPDAQEAIDSLCDLAEKKFYMDY